MRPRLRDGDRAIISLARRRGRIPERLSPHSVRVNVANHVMWRPVMVVREIPRFGAACRTSLAGPISVNVANHVMWRPVTVVREFPKFGAACAT